MKGFHTVRAGESFHSIARHYNVDVVQLIEANKDLWTGRPFGPNMLYIGERVRFEIETEYERCRRMWEETGDMEWLYAMLEQVVVEEEKE
jgi:hypothetical protein